MSTSLDTPVSGSISKSEFLSSLPRWRRFLAMLNWHPVVEYEIREIEFKQREIEHEKRMKQLRSETEQMQREQMQREIVHEQRMQQLASETEQLRSEEQQLAKEDERLAELDAKIAALWPSSTSSSAQMPPPEGDSPT